ncbi:hypothetical protein EK0264_13865 [Epidermidibacterium keratini]|uniref:Uncharacterized protein n=1 Tax=Epidermidibacterium keratini TaxID=1891644 RepID=A0A7L4YQF8_9ACTN|nr:hypothetical protein [Epidermidibacterium keratini]QHC01262.1 hypothetical protein EK0264_13865 [Epidermidibacterium keratini]
MTGPVQPLLTTLTLFRNAQVGAVLAAGLTAGGPGVGPAPTAGQALRDPDSMWITQAGPHVLLIGQHEESLLQDLIARLGGQVGIAEFWGDSFNWRVHDGADELRSVMTRKGKAMLDLGTAAPFEPPASQLDEPSLMHVVTTFGSGLPPHWLSLPMTAVDWPDGAVERAEREHAKFVRRLRFWSGWLRA